MRLRRAEGRTESLIACGRLYGAPEISGGGSFCCGEFHEVSSFLYATCDTGVARAMPAGADRLYPGLILATTILASSLAFVDGSVVNVGLPAIRASLGARDETLQWVINAYLLPVSSLILLGGAAGDRFGRKRFLMLGVAVFALASLLCALANSPTALIFSRVVQGIGAAILLPNSLAVLGETFTGEARGRAVGTWASVAAVVGAIGPVLGGWLIDMVGWRAIFLINLPLAIAAIALAFLFVPLEEAAEKRTSLDLWGGVLATAGLGGLTWGLTVGSGPAGWNREAAIAVWAGGMVLIAFVGFERARGGRAMMPLELFLSRTFVGLTLLTLFLYGALGGLIVLLPYVLITAAHYSATAAGAALLPLPLVMACASPFTGALAARIGPRLPLSIGPLLVAGGFGLLMQMDESGSYWSVIFPAMLLIALGMSLAAAPLTTAVLGSVDAAHQGSASGFNSAASRIGGLVATALLGSALAATGPALMAEVSMAAIAGAIAAIAASLSAFTLVQGKKA